MAYTRIPTNRELQQAAHSASRSVSRRMIPDPLQWADLISNPALSRIVAARDADGSVFDSAHAFPWPKDNGTLRQIAWIDPIDEIGYHVLVGRTIPYIESVLDRTRVTSTRVAGRPPAWTLAPYRAAVEQRDLTARAAFEAGSELMGVIDVENYFATANLRSFTLALPGGLLGHFANIESWLQHLHGSSGVVGLPVGLDASSVIGNFLLRACDEPRNTPGMTYVRYMDDIWMFPPSESSWQASWDRIMDALARLGLRPNMTKSVLLDRAAAMAVIGGGHDYALIDDAPGAPNPEALEELRDLAQQSETEAGRVRQLVGSIAQQPSKEAIELLCEHEMLFGLAPKQWRRALIATIQTKSQRDPAFDWIIDAVSCATVTPAHLLTALIAGSHVKLSRNLGETLETIVTGSTLPTLASWASMAWRKSKAFRPKKIVGLCEATSDNSTRRILIGCIRDTGLKSASRVCASVAGNDPQLRAVAEWALAA